MSIIFCEKAQNVIGEVLEALDVKDWPLEDRHYEVSCKKLSKCYDEISVGVEAQDFEGVLRSVKYLIFSISEDETISEMVQLKGCLIGLIVELVKEKA